MSRSGHSFRQSPREVVGSGRGTGSGYLMVPPGHSVLGRTPTGRGGRSGGGVAGGEGNSGSSQGDGSSSSFRFDGYDMTMGHETSAAEPAPLQ